MRELHHYSVQDSRNVHVHTRVTKQKGSCLTNSFRGFPFLSFGMAKGGCPTATHYAGIAYRHAWAIQHLVCVCAQAMMTRGLIAFATYKRSKNGNYNYYTYQGANPRHKYSAWSISKYLINMRIKNAYSYLPARITNSTDQLDHAA